MKKNSMSKDSMVGENFEFT